MIDAKKKELIKELNEVMEGWIIMVETEAENCLELSLLSIKTLLERGYSGIILSASRPYLNLMDLYKKSEIKTEKIFVLDCISKTQSKTLDKYDNVLYLDGVSALTNISVSVDEAIKRIEGSKFIFIDSITTMLIHNEPAVFARFIHFTLTKMRMRGISGLLIYLETEANRELRAEIAQLCDKVIRI